MQEYTVMIFRDHSSPVRRYKVARERMQRVAAIAAVVSVALLAIVVDYVRVRTDVRELDALRRETSQQREQIAVFTQKVEELDGRFARLTEFERKVRVIANLPDAMVATDSEVPAGVGGGEDGEGGAVVTEPVPARGPAEAAQAARAGESTAWFSGLDQSATRLLDATELRQESLADLVEQLRGKSDRLASTPSVWPAKGWVTSGFGRRISPFTGLPQAHNGLDIAAEHGTPIAAPARGRVTFAGHKGPLGKAVEIDHGFGLKTLYGHCSAIHVKKGQRVERGQWIAEIGDTGRSTGPHLHYAVLRNGRPENPRKYILD